MKRPSLEIGLALLIAAPVGAVAQDANYLLPVEETLEIIRDVDFDIIDIQPSRGLPGERTMRATIKAGDRLLQVKYAPAEEGADDFNNRPRYELAAYEIQKLFLDQADWVVPPTVVRPFPLNQVEDAIAMVPGDDMPEPEPTFDEWPMVLVTLQYWLFNIEIPHELRDDDLLEEHETYERLLGNFNLLTYIIRHNDSNEGNFLRSADPSVPRVFSVDNGVAFTNEESNRGYYWRDLKLDAYPSDAIDRLRGYTLEDLYARLGVLVEFELQGGEFVEVEPTGNLDPGDGVRHDDVRIQLGLTDREIRNVHRRIERLVGWVDDGRYELIP